MDEQTPIDFTRLYKTIIAKKPPISGRKAYIGGLNNNPPFDEKAINEIISGKDINKKRMLSRYFFHNSGMYQRTLIHYSTLFYYQYCVIPNVSDGKRDITYKKYSDKYYKVINFLKNSEIPNVAIDTALNTLIDGCFFGVIQKRDNSFYIQRLDPSYCKSDYNDQDNRPLVQFNLNYFYQFTTGEIRDNVLKAYPIEIQRAWRRLSKGRKADPDPLLKMEPQWAFISPEKTICMTLYGEDPLFLPMIRSIEDVKQYRELDKEKEIQNLSSIFTQEVPYDNQKSRIILSEPEIGSLHEGVADMLSDNPYVDVVTTPTKTDVKRLNEDNSALKSNLIDIIKSAYGEAGISNELFIGNTTAGLKASLLNDEALMNKFLQQFQAIINTIVNSDFSIKNKLRFSIQFLDVTRNNRAEYIRYASDSAKCGYSFLLVSTALGIEQNDFVSMKNLENNLLKLSERMVPLQVSYTQSGKAEANTETSKISDIEEPDIIDGKDDEDNIDDTDDKDGMNDIDDIMDDTRDGSSNK